MNVRRQIPTWMLVAVLFALGGADASWSKSAELISRTSGANGAAADADAGDPSVSANGQVIAFRSEATNLVPEDRDQSFDVYARERRSNRTSLVSRANGVEGAKANGASGSPAVSASGRFVAFGSTASNLTADPMPGGLGRVYVRDLLAGTTTLVSRADGGAGAPANASSYMPAISADGRFIAFASEATNLARASASRSGGVAQVYVRDLLVGTTMLISRADGEGVVGNGSSFAPVISADGSVVAYTSFAFNLDPADTSDHGAIYVRDLETSTTSLASRASGADGNGAGKDCRDPTISANGRYVAFSTAARNLRPNEQGFSTDVFVRDLRTERTTLASRDFRAKGSQDAERPSLSSSGRYVSFAGTGRADRDRAGEGLFVRDLRKGKTRRVQGTPGSGSSESLGGRLTGSGAAIAFQSDAASLLRSGQGVQQVFYSRVRP